MTVRAVCLTARPVAAQPFSAWSITGPWPLDWTSPWFRSYVGHWSARFIFWHVINGRLYNQSMGINDHRSLASELNVALVGMLCGPLGSLAYVFDMSSVGVCTTRHRYTSGRLEQHLNVCSGRYPSSKPNLLCFTTWKGYWLKTVCTVN